LVIGATNLPFDMDSAATRRFKTEIFVPHPGKEGMTELWRTELSDVDTVGPIDYEELGELSADFTPSEITNQLLQSEIQSELVLSALDDGQDDIEIDIDYLREKIKNTEPKVIDRYISQVTNDFDDMGGYEELQEYIIKQYESHDESDGN
jgi:transitional endoplasmic reticulum ATPase